MLEALKKPSETLEKAVSSGNKIIEMSREALAKKIGIKIEELPDGEFFKVVDEQLDQLEGLDPKKKIIALKKTISDIRTQEAVDKAKDLGEGATSVVKKIAPEGIPTVINGVTEKLKDDLGASGKEAMVAAGALVSATSIDGATGGIERLTRAVDAISTTFSGAMKSIKEAFSSIMSMLGLDKFWNSLKGLFGLSSATKTKTETEKNNEKEKKLSNNDPLKKTPNALADIMDPEKAKQVLDNYSQQFADMISKQYFDGRPLSKNQLDTIRSIVEKNTPQESLEKIIKRYETSGDVQMGEFSTLLLDVSGLFPAKVFFDLSLSGIIPYSAIAQRIVVEPSKTLILMTIDGLPGMEFDMSLGDFGKLIDAKSDDSHAKDIARIQLYGINGLLWRTMGTVVAGAAGLGIMALDTTSKANGLTMANATLDKNYAGLADEFAKIETTLSGKTERTAIFNHMLDGMKQIQTNAIVMQIASDHMDNPKQLIQKLTESKNQLKISPEYLDDLTKNIDNENIFRERLKKILENQSTTAGYGDDFVRGLKRLAGGLDGSVLNILNQVDAIKAHQLNLIGTTGLRSKIESMKLAMQSLTMARSADTIVIHIDSKEDISKFRAFLSTIPGGIRGIAEVLPAAAVVFSLGSIGMDALKDEPGMEGKESLWDVMLFSLIPAYGSGNFLWSKTVNMKEFISQGKIPPIQDMALTGAIGAVGVFEVMRVGSGLKDIATGEFAKGAKKLTYIHDIGRSAGIMTRGIRNIAALASHPIATPELTKTLTKVAAKIPKKGKIGVGAALAILAVGGTYAYAAGDEEPEDIMKNLHKEGLLDIKNNPTEKMKELFQQKDIANRKKILDELFIMHQNTNEGLPKTHYDDKTGKYTLVIEGSRHFAELIDSPFRETIQSLGVDIDFEDVPA